MSKQECEKLILDKLKEIKDIYDEYNPSGEYLTLSIIKERPMDVTLFLEDGEIIRR